MTSYFHGWRRKSGILALIFACVSMAVWVRSRILVDYIEIPVGKHTSVFMVTFPEFFVVLMDHDPDVTLPFGASQWISHPTAKFTPEDFARMNYSSLQMEIKYRNHPPVVPKGPNQPIRVPKLSPGYWLVGLPISYLFAIPPTLIAAYLLLGKSRKVTTAPREGEGYSAEI